MDKLTSKDFNIVIPCFNENRKIFKVVKDFLSLGVNRIIVINDASTDKTLATLKNLPITVLTNTQNRGQGYSILRGLNYSNSLNESAFTITADADGQHESQDIRRVINKAIETNAKIVYAVRQTNLKIPFSKLISNIGAKITLSYLLKIKIEDPLCGLRAFKNEVIPDLRFRDRYEWAVDCARFIDKNIADSQSVYVKPHYSKYSLSKGLVLKNGFHFLASVLSHETKLKYKKIDENLNYNQ